ncbi:vanadium-dependent haloperoxidase [Tabrizicola sp. J26]|uniref:vanadium-dependent haloperoxidase n=1 Tax=Alitabrizicola rongguiensis TaxID=2909234 RepID=UPI001F3E2472|nr:vanadium-dependent haloperoxidase [Tabrizicola rongguiensis]MCF1710829.1 vanadium-dependent haloperoxidase [Tabrizicola rongguiensis]
MDPSRRDVLLAGLALQVAAFLPRSARAEAERPSPEEVMATWYRLVLELVRHTPTYSPPVASRAFAYLGISVYEALAQGKAPMVSLAGQLHSLKPVPAAVDPLAECDEAVLLHSVFADAVRIFFSNTGPTGQRAMKAMTDRLGAKVAAGLSPEVVERSAAQGRAVVDHIVAWSQDDGGAVIENMGFPLDYEPSRDPGHWRPTSTIAQQQAPLLPNWGTNRPFAMPSPTACTLPPPPAYSEEKGTEFYAEALEVYETVRNLTPEQTAIARFWSDDPMLSTTPPGHWNQIALEQLEIENAPARRRAEVMARLGITVADAFIACWQSKYEYDLVRPVTYIKKVIDKTWEPLLITPPFPEYPSGHSTQSGAAARVLTAIWGNNFAFTDTSHEDDGLPSRSYPSFWAAADEAGISRLYGGIHFRSAIDRGLEQGRCVGAFAVALKMGAQA